VADVKKTGWRRGQSTPVTRLHGKEMAHLTAQFKADAPSNVLQNAPGFRNNFRLPCDGSSRRGGL
jgi:hypothetical protein